MFTTGGEMSHTVVRGGLPLEQARARRGPFTFRTREQAPGQC